MERAERRPEPFRVLFVCTGNTCRSPMAEALARRELEARGWSHVEVASAGVATMDGLPASEGAVRAARSKGLDLSTHRSTRLTGRGLAGVDLVLVMSPGHLARVEELGGAARAHVLTAFAAPDDEGGDAEGGDAEAGVPDPFGGSDELYRETLEALEELVDRSLRRLEPILAP